jgi:hypothetical protein
MLYFFIISLSLVFSIEAKVFFPKINKGEVKISYPCEAISRIGKMESEQITFYVKKIRPETQELIVRHRLRETDQDFTLKYRKSSTGGAPSVDKELYDLLKARDKAGEVKFKCEADVTFLPKGIELEQGCSLTTPTDFFTTDHSKFMQMVGISVPINRPELASYQINSFSWKKDDDFFPKGISLEKWSVKNSQGEELCILEASAKFEVSPGDNLGLEALAARSMKRLQEAFRPLLPDKAQGNKTGRVLAFLTSKSGF